MIAWVFRIDFPASLVRLVLKTKDAVEIIGEVLRLAVAAIATTDCRQGVLVVAGAVCTKVKKWVEMDDLRIPCAGDAKVVHLVIKLAVDLIAPAKADDIYLNVPVLDWGSF